ncbi:MAG: hypothetical protein IJT15_03475 [Rickettsiales bacterium]|nr:hypothetical protein [Rickettsiales bacterium]
MPKDGYNISNDELVMDEDIKPNQIGKDNFLHQFSSNYVPTTSKDRKPVLPFFLGFLGTLALFIGLCFVSAWFAFGFIASAGLFIFTIKNNNYNNKQEAEELTPTPLGTDTPIPDLVVENINEKNINPHNNNINRQDEKEAPIGNENIKDIKNEEKKFEQNMNENCKNQQDTKSNFATKTNLDLINTINKDSNKMEK